MKRAKTVFLVLSLSILALSVMFACIFSLIGNNGGFFGFAPSDGAGLGIYIAMKVIVSIALIVVVIVACFTKKHQEGISAVVLSYTLGLQFLPLLNRGFAQMAKYVESTRDWAFVIPLAIEAIVLVIYLAIVLTLSLYKKRLLQTKEEVKPAEVGVQPAQSVFDDNGDFKGPRG